LDALIPILYLRGISSGDFQEALSALLGKDAPNLSPAVLGRLKASWKEEFERWRQRDLSARRYVYIWADGVYLQARMEVEKQCILVLIGATPEGRKELIGFQTGFRESTQSWTELLTDLKSRGLSVAPELAIGDGALGFWKALEQQFGATRHQRCWVHKAMNVLNKLPKSVQPRAKADLREIWMAEGRDDAEKAFDRFLAKYQTKYDKAADAWPRIVIRCSPSTTSRPNTGSIFAPATRTRAHLPPSGIAQCAPSDASVMRPLRSWSSS
jgi:transposase-like protein